VSSSEILVFGVLQNSFHFKLPAVRSQMIGSQGLFKWPTGADIQDTEHTTITEADKVHHQFMKFKVYLRHFHKLACCCSSPILYRDVKQKVQKPRQTGIACLKNQIKITPPCQPYTSAGVQVPISVSHNAGSLMDR